MHIRELQTEVENLKSQVNFEQRRFKELENVLASERRNGHENEI